MPTSFDDLVRAPLWLELGETGLRVVLTIGLAVVVLGIVARVKRRWVARAQAEAVHTAHRQRVLTLSDLLGSVARYAVWTVATV
ncbi:MAG TPA: hypothetical protein VF576_12070, partial [Rubricoccaceae bacterium]